MADDEFSLTSIRWRIVELERRRAEIRGVVGNVRQELTRMQEEISRIRREMLSLLRYRDAAPKELEEIMLEISRLKEIQAKAGKNPLVLDFLRVQAALRKAEAQDKIREQLKKSNPKMTDR